jgi:predicted nucleic acid-binding protein
MILADTSVWIRYLYTREPFARHMRALLDTEQVAGHEMVFGELLVGDTGGRAQLLEAYGLMHQAATVAHEEVAAMVRKRKWQAKGVGWIDMHVLASALAAEVRLWTADPRLEELARECGIAYDVSK